MKDVPVEQWVDAQEAIYKEAFEKWPTTPRSWPISATTIVPPGRSSTPIPVIRTEIDEPYYPFKSALDKGESPFNTPTKKIEFASNFVKTHDMTESRWRGRIDPMPVWSPSYVEGDISTASNDGFYNPKVKKYPLSLVTPVSVYRQHSSNDNNPFMREDVYRHAVWISGVDAKARGIKDGDICRVYSDRGETVLTAYVTNRCMPGTAAVHHGAWYQTNGETSEMNESARICAARRTSCSTTGTCPTSWARSSSPVSSRLRRSPTATPRASAARPSAAAPAAVGGVACRDRLARAQGARRRGRGPGGGLRPGRGGRRGCSHRSDPVTAVENA